MTLTYINFVNSNITLFDNTSLSFIYDNICDLMINSYLSSDICKISGYQLQFFNSDILANGHVFIIDCGIDNYETTCDYCDYLDSIEFIHNSLSDPHTAVGHATTK